MIYPGRHRLRGDLRSTSIGHKLQKSRWGEDDGRFFSVAQSTKRMGLLQLNKRKNFLSLRVVRHRRVGAFSLEDLTNISILKNGMAPLGPSGSPGMEGPQSLSCQELDDG